jgi:hypothetical protein
MFTPARAIEADAFLFEKMPLVAVPPGMARRLTSPRELITRCHGSSEPSVECVQGVPTSRA